MNAVAKALVSRGYLDVSGRMRTDANGSVAGELGFEPRQTESESVVLPLHHSPIIAQRHQYVRPRLGKCSRREFRESRELAPFYSLPPALGKRAGIALLQGGPANPGHLWRLRRSQDGADEPFFRRAGFPPDADGRAEPEAPQAADV